MKKKIIFIFYLLLTTLVFADVRSSHISTDSIETFLKEHDQLFDEDSKAFLLCNFKECKAEILCYQGYVKSEYRNPERYDRLYFLIQTDKSNYYLLELRCMNYEHYEKSDFYSLYQSYLVKQIDKEKMKNEISYSVSEWTKYEFDEITIFVDYSYENTQYIKIESESTLFYKTIKTRGFMPDEDLDQYWKNYLKYIQNKHAQENIDFFGLD
ncbi:MAG: hypothetical protein K6E69_07305 [Treponema sp.]|uniref:hypothetical protein n=1 Tax=Treponema sp. TaxID=166 RepID=UPI00298EBE49|nr:hypothetical protein [Treponema sp.]MCR5386912.1 hypothetical protein [Treponema sp.]